MQALTNDLNDERVHLIEAAMCSPAVSLAHFEGLTYWQIVDRLGLPVGTFKSRIRSALTSLAHTVVQDLGDR